jgi:hypothetical protein
MGEKMGTAPENTGETSTALATLFQAPALRDELVIAQKQCDKAARKEQIFNRLGLPVFVAGASVGIGGLGTLLCAATLLHPATAVIAGVVLLCGGASSSVIAVRHKDKLAKAANAASTRVSNIEDTIAKTEAARCEALRLAARSILMRDTGAYTVGQELPVEVHGETPKILRIQAVGTVLDDKDRPSHKISAGLYEAEAQADGAFRRGERVANVPTIICSVPLVPDLAPSLPPKAPKQLPPYAPGPA